MNKQNIFKRVTYILNMLLILPIVGWTSTLICGGIEGMFRKFLPYSNLPLWARIISMVLLVVLFMVLFGIYQYRNGKYHWSSVRFLLLTLYTGVGCNFFGKAEANRQFMTQQGEHQFFWSLFERALATHTDFQTAVASMSEVHGDVMHYIGFNVWPYIGSGKVLIYIGVSVILLSWLVIFFSRKWKYRTWIVVLLLPVGLALFGYGNYNLAFGREIEKRSKVLFFGQKKIMVEMKKITPTVSNDAIIPMIREYVAEWKGPTEPYHRLIEKLEGKRQNDQD